MSLPGITAGNDPPQVDAGNDQTITLPASALLDGSVSDDGIPNPPGFTTTIWRQVSGPESVTFANANAVDTMVSFDSAGIYVLRLAADDDELVTTDDVTLTVLGPGGELVIEAQAATTSDDAEERFSGSVATGSSDLEMVSTSEDGGGNQVVGLRFPAVSVPRESNIVQAFIQFQADESDSEATVLTIRGEATDDALTFAPSLFDISSRPKTLASVPWSPPAWQSGASGPDQQTPGISSIIQEIVNRSGWSSGNALTILIDGQGKRVAEAADRNPTLPRLHVEFIPPPLTVGNLLWHDVNRNGIFDSGAEALLGGVQVNLRDGGGSLITSTTSDGGGLYSFGGLLPGDYIVEIPASEFGFGEPLYAFISTPGASDPDNDIDNDDNGVDSADPATFGISSLAVTLFSDTEPCNQISCASDDGDADPDTNLTVDFGFVRSVDLADGQSDLCGDGHQQRACGGLWSGPLREFDPAVGGDRRLDHPECRQLRRPPVDGREPGFRRQRDPDGPADR
jgi:hypothetical protein